MKHRSKISFLLIIMMTFTISACSSGDTWENFKLRLNEYTKFFSDQSQELEDIRQQGLNPEMVSRIDLDLLQDGGPPKDGIPSIDRPQFDSAETTPFDDDELVVALEINGDARAYPYGIMNWHEVVNDTVGGIPVTISYCPLCDTMLVHNRHERTFGVSGKLFQSCLVMYDRTDDTLYAQPWAIGIVGPAVNRPLSRHPVVKTTLGKWLAKHPDSKILSTRTGYSRKYFDYPYGSYMTNDAIIFPVRHQQLLTRPSKTIISYIWDPYEKTYSRNTFTGVSRAVTHQHVRAERALEISYGQKAVMAIWDSQLETVVFQDQQGRPLISSTAFAFVYPAFFEKPIGGEPGG